MGSRTSRNITHPVLFLLPFHLPYKTITKMALLPLLTRLLPLLTPTLAANSTFTNPILPGWHSDPSCIYHSSSSTFFCATSTFIAFPGLPIYASKDLLHWKLISHVWNREAQLSGLSWGTPGQQDGLYAPTLIALSRRGVLGGL